MFKLNYKIWEKWLYVSIVWFIGMFLVGTMLGSVQVFPNWDLGFLICCINLLACIGVGLKSKGD